MWSGARLVLNNDLLAQFLGHSGCEGPRDVWSQRKDYDRAIQDYDAAIRINPQLALTIANRGSAKKQKGDVDGAIADYVHAIEVNPNLATAYNSLAWELATAERPTVRDGGRAVESALKACELSKWQIPAYIDTLAAAYARAGNFDDAIKWQRKAMQDLGRGSLAGNDDAEQRLQRYEQRKAWPPD